MTTQRLGTPAGSSGADPRIGRVLQDRYVVQGVVASGGMGVVYRGERVQLGRAVAIKFLHPWMAAQEAFLRRFELEAKAMSRLAHPHCLSVIDFGVDHVDGADSPYLVMDFVTGRTLRQLIAEGPQPPARAIGIARQILSALAHAHAQGIIHRDIKPDNVVLTDGAGLTDHVRILDFGLVKLADGGQGLTTGLIIGTPAYMAPEQTGLGVVDARVDLYAVGVVLFELLTGRKPYEATKPGELMRLHREAPIPRLGDGATGAVFPPALIDAVARAMAKDPAARFADAAQMAAALEPPAGAPTAGGIGEADDAPDAPALPEPLPRRGAPPELTVGGGSLVQPTTVRRPGENTVDSVARTVAMAPSPRSDATEVRRPPGMPLVRARAAASAWWREHPRGRVGVIVAGIAVIGVALGLAIPDGRRAATPSVGVTTVPTPPTIGAAPGNDQPPAASPSAAAGAPPAGTAVTAAPPPSAPAATAHAPRPDRAGPPAERRRDDPRSHRRDDRNDDRPAYHGPRR